MKKILIFVFILASLSGCASKWPKYVEPNPSVTETAKLRVVVFAGVSATVLMHPNTNSRCLDDEGATAMPIHTNISGFSVEGDKRIGMPASDPFLKKIGNEMYIPASKPIVISASYSGGNGIYTAYCHNAFKFHPKKGVNYEIMLHAGASGRRNAECTNKIYIIKEDQKNGFILEPMEVTPIMVEGSPAWEEACKASTLKKPNDNAPSQSQGTR